MSNVVTKSQPEMIAEAPARVSIHHHEIEPAGGSRTVDRLRLLWENRRSLMWAIAVGCAAGLAIAFLLPAQYQSSVQLMPPDSQPGSGMLLASLAARTSTGMGSVAGDLLGMQTSGDLFLGVLRSRTVQDRVVKRFGLKQVYKVKLDEDARSRLAQNTGLGVDRKSGIIDITVTDRVPQRASAIAGAYVDELDRLVAEVSTSAAHRERVFLEERLKAVKLDLDSASREFSEFASKNAAIDIKDQGRAMVEGAARVQGELIAAQSELRGLEQIYAPGNVRVRSAQARVTELSRQLQKLGGGSAADEVSAIPGKEGATIAATESTYPSLRSLPLLGVTYADLLRRTKMQEAIYDSLTQQFELAKVQEAKETPSVKVLDAASLPERKSFPPRLLIVMWCGAFAVAAATTWILLRAFWERANPEDPGISLAREVLQTVDAKMPWHSPNGSRAQAASQRVWTRLAGRGETDKWPDR